MAVMTQLQLEGSSTVYDLNDARISSTSVSTATHFLGTNSSVSAINPISAADLASVLGVAESKSKWNMSTVDDLMAPGFYLVSVSSGTGLPFGTCTFMLLVIGGQTSNTGFDRCAQIAICIYANGTYSLGDTKIRCKASTGWTEWRKVTMS